ncbi:MAG TPA: hypothetical protein VEK07_07945 [Polyangiaceae bacterium]|nr:hypothetical protein [Polyangiaceae bacterium]
MRFPQASARSLAARCLAAVLVIGATGVPRLASAWGPASFPVAVEVGTRVGGATSPTGPPDPFAFEAGGRADVMLAHFYAGFSFMFSLGSASDSSCVGPVIVACSTNAGMISASAHSMRYGAQAGYDIALWKRFSLRPEVGIGTASFRQTSPAQILFDGMLSSLDASANKLYAEPSIAGLFAFGHLFVGADAGAVVLPTLPHSSAALEAHAQVGLRFW